MKLTWAERLTWSRFHQWMNRLPFRGRLLSFAGGTFLGGGGIAGFTLYLRSEDASRPPDNEPAVLPDQDQQSSKSGPLKRWVYWPLPRWSTVNAELMGNTNTTELLILSKGNSSGDIILAGGNPGIHGSGRRGIAIPTSGATIEIRNSNKNSSSSSSTSSCEFTLQTSGGDREFLQAPAKECHDWMKALKSATSRGATVGQQHQAQRRRMVDVSFPPHWEAPWDRFRLVKLKKKSPEYQRVAKLAIEQQYQLDTKSKHPYVKGRIKVCGVSRIQAPRIWEAYRMRRSIIAGENYGNPNEKWLWHGSTKIDKVLEKGFDPRVCLLSGMFGGGVYFADLSTKSVRYAGAQKKGDKGQLLLCRVALGRQMIKYMPKCDLRRPPEPYPLFPSQTLAWWNGWHYHSLFAPGDTIMNVLLMNEYIVYHSNQGYPEYLVDFEIV